MPRTFSPAEIETAAEYLCLRLHPKRHRERYATDIRAAYHAPEIINILQELSTGLTSIFLGVIANRLYDKLKGPDKKIEDIEHLLKQQEKVLRKLALEILKERDTSTLKTASEMLAFHKKQIVSIQDSDPAIARMAEDVIRQLESRGQKALEEEINSEF